MGVVALGVEGGDKIHSRSAVDYTVPRGFYVQSERTDSTHTGDHHPMISIHISPAHTLAKAQLRAFTNHN